MNKAATGRQGRTFRTLLIEPFKQIKVGFYVLILALAFVVITGVVFVNAFDEQYQHVMSIFQVVDPQFKWEVVTNDIFFTNIVRLIVVLASFIVVLFLVIFRTTHRYYGPLVAITRFVEDITRGDYTRRVVVRRSDELQELALALNEMADVLQKRHGNRVGDALDRRKS